MIASVTSGHDGYVVVAYMNCDNTWDKWHPIANTGWNQGAAIEIRDLVRNDHVSFNRVCGMARQYCPKKYFDRPRVKEYTINFPLQHS